MSIVGYQSTPQVIKVENGGTVVNSQREIPLSSEYTNVTFARAKYYRGYK